MRTVCEQYDLCLGLKILSFIYLKLLTSKE